jgi:Ca-activated chloride channel family protein
MCTKNLFLFCALLFGCFLSNCTKEYGGGLSGGFISDGGFTGSPQFTKIAENPFIKTIDSATSTFSIDADGASYAAMRRWTTQNGDLSGLKEGIRTEEFINYFTYDYPDPAADAPIAVNGEVSGCPWNEAHKLVRIGIKGQSVAKPAYPFANFVLLIDVSGSMQSPDKLELLKSGFTEFVNGMRPQDKLAIVTYAGNAGLVLDATSGSEKARIIAKINGLESGGSTNGAAGINLAYEIAEKNFIAGGNNRVILGTDGDFNVGIASQEELVKLVESKRDKGIFLTTLGVGMDNLNDGMMEQIANKGNGNYEYLDNTAELKKVFIEEYNKFLTVAKDVKVQLTFNPDIVEEYRLIGYENRVLQSDDFTNDKQDAGEIGAGQTITALYEIKPKPNTAFKQHPSFSIGFRYKKPDETTSRALTLDVFDKGHTFEQASENLRFAASVAALGLYLRNSDYKGTATLSQIKGWARNAVSFDPHGYRAGHLLLLDKLK